MLIKLGSCGDGLRIAAVTQFTSNICGVLPRSYRFPAGLTDMVLWKARE